jgi:hypothetical protein
MDATKIAECTQFVVAVLLRRLNGSAVDALFYF